LSDERVKQVKEANDIVDVVGAYLSLRPAGGTFKALCPFHDDSRPSFDVDPRRQRYRCWACGKHGDVLSFVQEFEHVSFPEAMEQLARRAGITLEPNGPPGAGQQRGQLLDVMRWAAKQFHECLLDDPLAEDGRRYLGERGLSGKTNRLWGLGFAPASGHWLVDLATENGVSLEHLEVVGLIGQRKHGPGYYDRFRDRVQFPIRDVRAQVVGFGGRILPTSPLLDRPQPPPKYYNSSDTPLFSKSEQLYGIDQARPAAEKAGYLAIVEGYTDVLMAHQMGVTQVVATMGTALNDRHLRQIRRFVPRVVLVFDADEGGHLGVDRALTLFATHDMDLSIAALPTGLDPCDLLVQQGPDPFRRVLECAADALEFKLDGMILREGTSSVEGRRRIVDAVLGVIALAGSLPGEASAVKIELMVSRIARRLALKEETVWARLDELRRARRSSESGRSREDNEREPARSAPASPKERRLLELLLAEPNLVSQAANGVRLEEISHPGLRRLLAGLFALSAAGISPTLDRLRVDLDDAPALVNKAFQLQDVGLSKPNRQRELEDLVGYFRQGNEKTARQELKGQLQVATDMSDAQAETELLLRVMNKSVGLGPDGASRGDGAGSSALSPMA
jgi:DNA primase